MLSDPYSCVGGVKARRSMGQSSMTGGSSLSLQFEVRKWLEKLARRRVRVVTDKFRSHPHVGIDLQ